MAAVAAGIKEASSVKARMATRLLFGCCTLLSYPVPPGSALQAVAEGDGEAISLISNWTITENTIFITVTLKPNVIIDVNSFSSIGFSIARKLNVPNQTWQPLTATIINGTGADSDSSNNSYNVIVKAQ